MLKTVTLFFAFNSLFKMTYSLVEFFSRLYFLNSMIDTILLFNSLLFIGFTV